MPERRLIFKNYKLIPFLINNYVFESIELNYALPINYRFRIMSEYG